VTGPADAGLRVRIDAPMTRRGRARAVARLACTLIAAIFLAPAPTPAQAEPAQIAKNRKAEKKDFTDQQIIDGFFKTVFGAEFHVAGRTDRIRKYDVPVRVYIDSRAKPNRRQQVAAVIEDIRGKVRNLDIAVTQNRKEANVTVTLVRDRDLEKTIRSFYGRARAKTILQSLEPQCLSGFRKDDFFRIVKSDVIIVTDAGDFIFYDCVYEEILQSLGPINDDSSVPWTMFNDDVQMGFFDIYDQYLLNILYDPRIRPGMSADEVRRLLPQILPDVRAWVTKVNGLGG
jgi:hypothetical protein